MGIKDELQLLFDGYVAAYRAGDGDGCAAFFTADAELRSPYGPIARGRESIAKTHRQWTSEGAENKQLEVINAGVSGDLAWCSAEFTEGALTGEGVSLNVLERQPNGSWLIRVCSLNDREPLA